MRTWDNDKIVHGYGERKKISSRRVQRIAGTTKQLKLENDPLRQM
jgi:hypothetical protein